MSELKKKHSQLTREISKKEAELLKIKISTDFLKDLIIPKP
jgi:hypothetical protein